jgi:hypothetical protein
MNIETQFSIGSEFYFLSEKTKKIVKGTVYQIDTSHEVDKEPIIKYWHRFDNGTYEIIKEEFCFNTLDEVVQSIIG